MEFILEVTDQQADVTRHALDLWTRLATGDLAAILNHPEISRRLTTDAGLTTEHVRRLMENLKQAVFGLKADAYLGLLSADLLDSNRVAFDLLQVIAHHLRQTTAPPVQTAAQPLPTIRDKPYDIV